MENASKALIIAGSILISILIVGLGVIIYNNVSQIAGKSSLGTQEIASHNSPFENYFGTNVSGSNVKALLSAVTTNNNQAGANDEVIGNKIYVIKGDNDKSAVTASSIKTGRTYTIKVLNGDGYSDKEEADTAYWKNGFIKTIVVTLNTNAPAAPATPSNP